AVYGDYDVDGVTSIALLYSFLEPLGAELDYYIPDRYKEGYGLSKEGVEYARDNGVKLLIAMDCGITARDEARLARNYGIDLIICDHHLPGQLLPDACAVLDPKRPDCHYPYKELSGCGVTFKLAQAYAQTQHLHPSALEALLDLLAISIASDIVPITGENRTLSALGMQRLNRTERTGLKALIEQSGRQHPLTVSDIVFGLGPMINAAGRLADAAQAVRLLLSKEVDAAADYARILEYRNKLRREFDQRIAEEARALLAEDPEWAQRRAIVLYQQHWHKGVVGIAASRMVEQFSRPAIMLTESEGRLVGSARSVAGFDLYEGLRACKDLLISFGGHTHAAGLSLMPQNLELFRDRFETIVQVALSQTPAVPVINIAAEIELKDITQKFWNILRQFAPFGPGNLNPVFVAKGVVNAGYSRLLTGNHLRLSVKQGDSPVFNGVAFGQGDALAKVQSGQAFDLCFTIEEHTWEDRTSLQLMVKDMRF
ncbi:MAG: single-stranded-DNA-specific exonuclease RecJ, partial [Saprospiraceae bacterium]|nr:single-stranded-DNA-specific exonuclease RecJ [Saprospiraceae bacterium]